jgi:hypothetical protein
MVGVKITIIRAKNNNTSTNKLFNLTRCRTIAYWLLSGVRVDKTKRNYENSNFFRINDNRWRFKKYS